MSAARAPYFSPRAQFLFGPADDSVHSQQAPHVGAGGPAQEGRVDRAFLAAFIPDAIGHNDVAAVELGVQPAGKSGRDDHRGAMALHERFGRRCGPPPARARTYQHDAAIVELALPEVESLAADGDGALEPRFEGAGLNAQREDDADGRGPRSWPSSHLPNRHLQGVAPAVIGGQHGGRLEAAVHQAVSQRGSPPRPERVQSVVANNSA